MERLECATFIEKKASKQKSCYLFSLLFNLVGSSMMRALTKHSFSRTLLVLWPWHYVTL